MIAGVGFGPDSSGANNGRTGERTQRRETCAARVRAINQD
jgi:hypothetical protein